MNLIFDFDGTLVDSFSTAITIFNRLAGEFSFRKIENHEINDLKHLSSHEFIKYLNIPMLKIPRVLLRARSLIKNEMTSLATYPNMQTVLQSLKEMKINMGIVTSNSRENVEIWLARNGLLQHFNFIHGEPSLFGKHRILTKIIKSAKLDKHKTYYIGDETRDIEAAKKCDITSIAVTWGFNSAEVLAAHQPDHIITCPREVLNCIS